MTSITIVIPSWLAYGITVFLVVDVVLSLYQLKWSRRLAKAKREAKDREAVT